MRWVRFECYGGARWCPLVGVAVDGALEVLMLPMARCWDDPDRWASLFVDPALVIGWCDTEVPPQETQPEVLAAALEVAHAADVEAQWRLFWSETVPQVRVWVLDQLDRAEPYGLFDEELEAAGVSRGVLIEARRDLTAWGQVSGSSHRVVPPSQSAPRSAWRISRSGTAVLSRARARDLLVQREMSLVV